MYHTPAADQMQHNSSDFSGCLVIPAFLEGFRNTQTSFETGKSGADVICFHGTQELTETERCCPGCGCRMHRNDVKYTMLSHLPFGPRYSTLLIERVQLLCPGCGRTKMQKIPYAAEGHRITEELLQYTQDLLSRGTYTLKQVAELTGLNKNTVKAIDFKRLQDLYTVDGKTLAQPEKQARYLGIDEFKLHDGNKFATHIIDIETGHILWIQPGKKKQVVYDFIEHVGLDWMGHVQAVACDMNSDFEEAFREKCPHLEIVFDRFHIVRNFNDKVVNEVRKEEVARLKAEGDYAGAKSLKKTKYILTSNRSTLQEKDQEARDGKEIRKSSELFNLDSVTRREGYEQKYDELLKKNELFFTIDFIKEKLMYTYTLPDSKKMGTAIADIVWYCMETRNPHFAWFGRLLMNHHDGISAYASHHITSGKIEGINNKIKTIRRQAYGLPDDEYFFLKLIDASRRQYVRNPKSNKITVMAAS